MASGHRSPPSLIQTLMGDRRASEMLNTWQFSFKISVSPYLGCGHRAAA
jgi:hypothetical protein